MAADPPIDPATVMTRLRIALDEAEQFVGTMPSDKAGLLFLRDGRPSKTGPNRPVHFRQGYRSGCDPSPAASYQIRCSEPSQADAFNGDGGS